VLFQAEMEVTDGLQLLSLKRAAEGLQGKEVVVVSAVQLRDPSSNCFI